MPDAIKYILYFLIPIDSDDCIITVDYFKRKNKIAKRTGLEAWSPDFEASNFYKSLKSDFDVAKFLERWANPNQIIVVGSYSETEYTKNANIVPHAQEIEDLRYRVIKILAEQITDE